MNKSNFTRRAILLCVFALFLISYGCDKPDPGDENPPWLGGSNIETLDTLGKYDIFLQLMETAGYTESIEKQLFTLFVPNDSAFNVYFKSIGKTSVADLSKDEALQLFTLHVLKNPRSRYNLIYEYVWSEEQSETGEYASLFFRKPTLSTSLPYSEEVRYNKTFLGKTLLMYTGNKLVPLFTNNFFKDYFGAPDGSDYTFMYRNSTWGGSMQWHNAQVIKEEVRTSNGFLYFIDQVVAPMPNLDEYLAKHQETHGLYYDLAQRFAMYTVPKTDKLKRIMYKKSYNMISNIAEEDGPDVSTDSDGPKMKGFFTLFAPDNDLLQDYLDKTVLKYYPSIDSVPEITLYYILQTQISKSLCLISKISKNYYNFFGDPMTIQPSDIKDAFVCSNGVFYDMNRVLEPNVFACVPGRLFFDPNYSTFLYAINSSGLIGTISSPDVDVTLFAPNNEQMDAYNIRYNPLNDVMETTGDDGVWGEMQSDDLVEFIQDHIYLGQISDLSGEGYIEMVSKNFVHYKNGSVSSAENQAIGDKATVVEKEVNEQNGILYTIDNAIKSNYSMGELLVETPEFSKFAELLIQANLLDPNYVDQISQDTIPNLKFISEGNYWTAFIPDDNAMAVAEANGLIPTDPDELKNFLFYHFIQKKTIFDDGLISGQFDTKRVANVSVEGIKYAELDIANTTNSLIVTDNSGQKIKVDHKNANKLVSKGVVHKITSVLKY